MKITVVRPTHSHSAYGIAADTFKNLASTVSDCEIDIITDEEYFSAEYAADLFVLIGNDAANAVVADLYLTQRIDKLGIRYGKDDYLIRTHEIDGKRFMILAGGRPRAAIYAVYRYFEVFCGCRWFWDGDRTPKGELTVSGIDMLESPRFDYRGIRYFAHRSLHRFQAEHWSLEDWQTEIDWLLKKRLNLFMLRIGMDDVWQKAFPDIVPYPEIDSVDEKIHGEGYNDRTHFWSLQYRGELRQKLLEYAFERDLWHPEDCGTMTHWYSRTPIEFIEKTNPKMLPLAVSVYNGAGNQVWDIRDKKNLENYFKLTDTHVKEYGSPEIFHTIGLGERMYSKDREENKRMKLYVYHALTSHIKEKYPNAPLLIASWDLWMRFTPEEVQDLVAELDPSQAIIFDYTSETLRENNFTKWGIMGKFPWVLGLFSGYESQNEIRGPYDVANERIKLAKEDPMCKGFILWPELSHGDSFMIEYAAANSWNDKTPSVSEQIDKYCADRYPVQLAEIMSKLWHEFMPIVQTNSWSLDDKIHMHGYELYTDIISRTEFKKEYAEHYKLKVDRFAPYKNAGAEILNKLAEIDTDDYMTVRDTFDIARTIIGRYVHAAIFEIEYLYATDAPIERTEALMQTCEQLMAAFTHLLALHDDYSLAASFERMKNVTRTNPHFEKTLKNNAECLYCRSHIFENAEYLYIPEMKLLFDEIKHIVKTGETYDRAALKERAEPIRERYFATPLSDMDRIEGTFAEVVKNAARIIDQLDLGTDK